MIIKLRGISMEQSVQFANIIMHSGDMIQVNEFFTLKESKGKAVLYWHRGEPISHENTPTILMQALQIALPEIHIYPSTTDINNVLYSFKSYIINYFLVENGTYNIIQDYTINIDTDRLAILKDVHAKIIMHHKKLNNKEQNDYIDFWNVAFNKYLNACSCGSVESGIESLISCLETLIVNSTTEVTYRTCLFGSIAYTADTTKRKETFKFLKEMYNIRSKVIHGDIESLKKTINKNNLFDEYMKLKVIVSNILMKLYNKDKKEYIASIEKSLFECPPTT